MRAATLPTILVEYEITSDARIEEPDGGWSIRPCAPPGRGWRIADASRDRRTLWRRVRLSGQPAGTQHAGAA